MTYGHRARHLSNGFDLSRRPSHRAPAEDVAVKVEHALPRVGALVDDESIPAFIQPKLLSDVTRGEKYLSEQTGVFGLYFMNAGDVLLGDDQGMGRSHRANVPKRDHVIVLEDDLSGDLSRDDVAK